jgi:hypothetical protein
VLVQLSNIFLKPFKAHRLLFILPSLPLKILTFMHQLHLCVLHGSGNIWWLYPLYSINWLVFITKMWCVFCMVETSSLNIIHVYLNVEGLIGSVKYCTEKLSFKLLLRYCNWLSMSHIVKVTHQISYSFHTTEPEYYSNVISTFDSCWNYSLCTFCTFFHKFITAFN